MAAQLCQCHSMQMSSSHISGPATTSTDTDLNALPVSWVSLPAVS